MGKMVKAISQDLDDLGFVEGKDFIAGPRNSGRTERLLQAALAQLYFMDPGDEIWVVTHNWEHAKRLAERVANIAYKDRFGPKISSAAHDKMLNKRMDFKGGVHRSRYCLSFKGDRYIHFTAIGDLAHQLRGTRLTHDPAIFIDHYCYDFGFIQNADYDLYAVLSEMG